MRFKGRILKSGRFWAIEVPILDISSQGMSKAEAYVMIADAIEALVNRRGFRVQVFPGPGPEFEIGASDEADLTALLLKRARQRSRLSLAQVAARLGSRSPNSYARYEQGRAVPSIRKLSQLHAAVSGDRDLVLSESRFHPSADASPRLAR
jgi:hypothetical protein